MSEKIIALVACAVAGAALGMSLAHAGPRGAPGQRGPAGMAAGTGRLGVCWSSSLFTQDWGDGSSSTWVSYVSIDQAQVTGGVYQCPQGETFVSVTPTATP